MKSLQELIFEIKKVTPASPASKIPKKLPPKQESPKEKPKKSENSESTGRKIEDKVEKSPDLGKKPYSGKKIIKSN